VNDERSTMGTGERVEVRKDQAGEWRWTRYAANGEPLSSSTEGYENRQHAIEQAVKLNPGVAVEVHTGRFVLGVKEVLDVDDTGELLATDPDEVLDVDENEADD
jgi:uncharacterized protein YegP (UPF0339 family)